MALPHVRQPVSGDAPVTRPWYQWFQRIDAAIDSSGRASSETDANVTLIANALGSTDGTAAGLPTPLFDFGSAGSISAVRNGSNAWFLSLAGDAQNPGNAYYYGTGDTGTKGWFDLRAAITIYSDTAPDGHAGLKWVDTTTGIKYDWYVDADGGQWVEFGPESGTGGGGYPEGSAFPASPLTGDKFYRTDLHLLCYFDGTRWLTVNQYDLGIGIADFTSFLSVTGTMRWPVRTDFALYIERIACTTYTTVAGTTSNHWAGSFEWRDAANTQHVMATISTTGDAANTWISHGTAVGVALTSSAKEMRLVWTPTGSAGGIYTPASVIYRLIVT